jgi:hypothetical protein
VPKKKPEVQNQDLRIHYIKSSAFRVLSVDGAIGTVGPRGDWLQVALYSERFPIPKETALPLEEGRPSGQEKEIDGRRGIIRDVECLLKMTPSDAESIGRWLLDRVEEIKKRGEKV